MTLVDKELKEDLQKCITKLMHFFGFISRDRLWVLTKSVSKTVLLSIYNKSFNSK